MARIYCTRSYSLVFADFMAWLANETSDSSFYSPVYKMIADDHSISLELNNGILYFSESDSITIHPIKNPIESIKLDFSNFYCVEDLYESLYRMTK